MTARMFFGGWLYPDVRWIGAADFAAAFGKDEVDCAAMSTDVAQTSSAQAKKQFKALCIGIKLPPLHLTGKTIHRTFLEGFGHPLVWHPR